jgi:hypothetical protein
MRNPDAGIFLSVVLATALVASCGNPIETPKPPLPTPASSGTPGGTENPYHLAPVPCSTKKMPWEGAPSGRSQADTPTVVFTSVRKPQPTTEPGTGPECWEIVPNFTPGQGQNS